MNKPLCVGHEAQAEMEQASDWFESRREGLGASFLRAVNSAFAGVEETPHAGAPVPGVPDPDIRRLVLRRFPYQVVYIELPDRLQVLAVAHLRRRPLYWTTRIPT